MMSMEFACPYVRNDYACVQGLPSLIIIIVNAHAYAYTCFSCDSYACTCTVVTAIHTLRTPTTYTGCAVSKSIAVSQ